MDADCSGSRLRDDVLDAISFRRPARMPRLVYFTPTKLGEFQQKTGAQDPQDYFGQAHRDIGIEQVFVDTNVAPASAADYDSAFLNIRMRPTGLHHYVEVSHPMEQFDGAKQVEQYSFPDYSQVFDADKFAVTVRAIQDKGLAAVGCARLVFMLAVYLRSMERLLLDFYEKPDLVELLLDRLTGMSVFKARACAKAGVDVLFIFEDVASQHGMLMSPGMWRKWLKPRMRKVITAAREIRPGLPVLYDSDGNMAPIIDDLVDVGVNALSPMQPECMDLDALHKQYAGRMAFWGTIGVQQTMPFGTPADVTAAVRHSIDTYGCDGGLVIGPAHVISPDIPWENIVAFFEAVDRYGQGG